MSVDLRVGDVLAGAATVALSAFLIWSLVALTQAVNEHAEHRCRQEIAAGLIRHECRHHWDMCALYYNDCSSGERYEWERIGEGSYIARRVP